MGTYVILSRFDANAFGDRGEIKRLATAVSSRIKSDCPGVNWKGSYATLGRFDVVDIVESDSQDEVERAALIIRSLGHATTETLAATPWDDFLASL